MKLLDYALTAEKNAMILYENLADKTSLSSLRDLFIALSHDEREHLGMISAIKENPEVKLSHKPDLDTLPRIFERIIEEKGLEKLSKEEIDGYHKALKSEQDVLMEYEELHVAEEDNNVRALFDKIIEQEKVHLSVVKDLCVLVSEQQSWK